MMKRRIAIFGVLFNTTIFSCYYFVVKGILARWDPISFIGVAALLALPIGIGILVIFRKHITFDAMKWGMVIGIALALTFFGLTTSLRYTTATETAYFPCLNGIIAAVILQLMGKPATKVQWAMAWLAVAGMILLVINAPLLADHWRGDLSALIATSIYVGSTYVLETFLSRKPTSGTTWAMLGGACLSLALTSGIVLPFFGDWSIHPQLPQDIWGILFMGLLVLVSTMIIGAFGQQQVGADALVFIYILEPILADLGAALFLGERYPLLSYAGASLGILSVIGQSLLPQILKRMAIINAGKVTLPWFDRVHKPALELINAGEATRNRINSAQFSRRSLDGKRPATPGLLRKWPMI
jgi:drug/metabolite transporter (DMT)-like permease